MEQGRRKSEFIPLFLLTSFWPDGEAILPCSPRPVAVLIITSMTINGFFFFLLHCQVNFNCKVISINCKTISTVLHIPIYRGFSLFILTLSTKICLSSQLHPGINLYLTAFFRFTQVNFKISDSLTTVLHYHHVILDLPTSYRTDRLELGYKLGWVYWHQSSYLDLHWLRNLMGCENTPSFKGNNRSPRATTKLPILLLPAGDFGHLTSYLK